MSNARIKYDRTPRMGLGGDGLVVGEPVGCKVTPRNKLRTTVLGSQVNKRDQHRQQPGGLMRCGGGVGSGYV
eukprot:CAMPEP_0175959496 /NCGR_PEP_ID=MMETSP0108-20121206/34826_1 /TAXON_ID=195067 ORGANISM="Goniomonas pacifica, Strain CCMP1869" /NCGR_SAMPLE_ID=MMETSP0108 /ASSEMBLY_ACC=CAM_ASM_000204 /LENGTH=71 /DNA_ID=CAMNT_0017286949 /DNA_START=197 /DNA_END=412 /DNA_ORIENTATION=-